MTVLVTCKFHEDPIKIKSLSSGQQVSHYKVMGNLCCRGNESFYRICLKFLWVLSHTHVMMHIQFDQDWPIPSEIFKFESLNGRQTDGGQFIYYKLTL